MPSLTLLCSREAARLVVRPHLGRQGAHLRHQHHPQAPDRPLLGQGPGQLHRGGSKGLLTPEDSPQITWQLKTRRS